MLFSMLAALIGASLANSIYWADRNQKGCGEFDDQGKFIRIVPKHRCHGVEKYYVVIDGNPTTRACSGASTPKVLSAEAERNLAAVSHIPGLDFTLTFEDNYKRHIGNKCMKRLKAVLKKGPLFSSFLYKRSIPITEFPFVEEGDGRRTRFYHYTSYQPLVQAFAPEVTDRAKAHEQLIEDGTYLRIFSETRSGKHARLYTGSTYKQALFVASDPYSSSRKGTDRITLDLDPNSRIATGVITKYIDEFAASLKKEYPSLGACTPYERKQLFPIAAEDSGIALTEYKAITSSWYRQWFLFHGHGAIVGSDVN